MELAGNSFNFIPCAEPEKLKRSLFSGQKALTNFKSNSVVYLQV